MKVSKLDQTYSEDFVYYVSEYDEKETLENLGFKSSKESMLEYNPYQQEGWDD